MFSYVYKAHKDRQKSILLVVKVKNVLLKLSKRSWFFFYVVIFLTRKYIRSVVSMGFCQSFGSYAIYTVRKRTVVVITDKRKTTFSSFVFRLRTYMVKEIGSTHPDFLQQSSGVTTWIYPIRYTTIKRVLRWTRECPKWHPRFRISKRFSHLYFFFNSAMT